jgi:hypothetical protein
VAEPKTGEAFLRHEFDEAIAIQAALVEATGTLIACHPDELSRSVLQAAAPHDASVLATLQQLGEQHGATGIQEEVAGSIVELLAATSSSAASAPSEAYEAHAVILSAKRKQADAAGAMRRIARDQGDVALHGIALAMEQRQKVDAAQLADALAGFAVTLASRPAGGETAAGSRGPGTRQRRRATTGSRA